MRISNDILCFGIVPTLPSGKLVERELRGNDFCQFAVVLLVSASCCGLCVGLIYHDQPFVLAD